MAAPRLTDLRDIAQGDTITLDSNKLLSYSLDQLKEIMRICGLITSNIDTIGAAATAIINGGVIETEEVG